MTGAPASLTSALHVVARVGAERFAFPVSDVDEVIDAPAVAWVPGALEGMLGELRVRQRTMGAFDAAWAFGVARARGARPAGAALILHDDARRMALVVDDVEDLAMVEAESVRPVPAGADPEGLLRGVCFAELRGRRLTGLVRVSALVARVTGREARRAAPQGAAGEGGAP